MLRLANRLSRFSSASQRGLEDDYEALSVLGQGSTSRVFLGINVRNYHKVVLKMFKRMDESKIRREIAMLQQLRDCPNIVPLEAVFQNEGSKNFVFVMPHFPGTTLNHLIKTVKVEEARVFMRNILTALACMHSKGIMHRDIKPSNVLVCSSDDTIPHCRILDFGLTERYTPNEQYKYTVGTKCYKPPQLLLKKTNYTPKLDIWSSGLILAEMMYQVKPLFPYLPDEESMLKQVLKRCRDSWDVLTESEKEIFGRIRYEPPNTEKLLCPKGADLAEMMMNANPKKRPTAEECLRHPFFET